MAPSQSPVPVKGYIVDEVAAKCTRKSIGSSPVGLTPAACPKGGTNPGSTSLLTGAEYTVAIKTAAKKENFMIELFNVQRVARLTDIRKNAFKA